MKFFQLCKRKLLEMIKSKSIVVVGATRRDKIAKKLFSFAQLEPGWHYGTGFKINRESIYSALSVVGGSCDLGADKVEVFPVTSGSVLVSVYGELDSIDIYCRPDGSFDLVHESERQEPKDLFCQNYSELIAYIRNFKWSTRSDSSTHCTIVTNSTDSKAKQLNLQTMVYRSSTQSAPGERLNVNVAISENSIRKVFRAAHQYSFDSKSSTFQKEAA
jgi:hypothetical protein